MFETVAVFSQRYTVRARPAKALRSFTIASTLKMPEQLKTSEVEKGQDPTVAKQWDDETSTEKKFEDFADIADGFRVTMMGTLRDGIGVRLVSGPRKCNNS